MKDGFVYQFELGRVTHKTTGQVTEVLRTAGHFINGKGGGGGSDSTYDIVVKTQAEFEALIASPTWLDANSVALVGDGGALKFTSGPGIIVPDTVERVDGYNKARVYFSDYVFSLTYQQALTAPKTTFANIEFFINSSDGSAGLLTKEGIRVSVAMNLVGFIFLLIL